MTKTSSGFKLIQFARTNVPAGAERQERVRSIQEVLRSLNGRDLNIVTAVGGTGAVLRRVLLPKMTPVELRGALRYEADKYIPFKTEEAYLDFAILGDRPGGRMEVVLAAARREIVQAHLDLLKEAQVIPHAVDLETLALNNAWEVSHPIQESEVVVLIQVGARATILVFLVGSQFEFSREIPIGGEAFTQAVAGALKMDGSQAEQIKCQPQTREEEVRAALQPVWEKWFSQTRASFDFYEDQYGRRIEKLLLSGPSAHLSGFKEWLHAASEIPTELWDPVAGLGAAENSENLESMKTSLGVAVGLAVREVDSGSSRRKAGGS